MKSKPRLSLKDENQIRPIQLSPSIQPTTKRNRIFRHLSQTDDNRTNLPARLLPILRRLKFRFRTKHFFCKNNKNEKEM